MTRPRVDHSGLIAFAQELVRIRSVNDTTTGTTEAEASMFVADKMRSFGWDPMVEEIETGRFNVVAVLDGGLPGKILMFEGHSIEFLEKGTKAIEIKEGPFPESDAADKVDF